MRIVSGQELKNWLARGTTLERDSRGPKVVLLQDGRILKVFHARRHRLLPRLNVPPITFQRNANTLRQLGIPVPMILELLWTDKAAGLSACLYQPLPGKSIESILETSPEEAESLIPTLAAFIARLHGMGVYFRSLHLDNILRLPMKASGSSTSWISNTSGARWCKAKCGATSATSKATLSDAAFRTFL